MAIRRYLKQETHIISIANDVEINCVILSYLRKRLSYLINNIGKSMAKIEFKTIDEYHKAFPTVVSERMQLIRQLIHRVAPEAEEVISYSIPAFKIGKKFLIYYSAYTQHLSLSSPWSADLLKTFETELKTFKVSKSAIQLPHQQELPLKLIEKLIKFRKKETEASKEGA